MQKIGDIPNTRADSNGEFTDGNVAGGTPPTILPAEWFNTIQRELINVLVAGGVTPDTTKFNQLITAISKLITDGGFLKTTNNLSEIKGSGTSRRRTNSRKPWFGRCSKTNSGDWY
ncbi:bacteriophage tail fiber protein [Yersinia ruckeri]|uniref:Bacteriophage tail fiber protein n=1 Tax=Yersinia ruckeri TaxID=29486 RepID=A0A380S8U9_YERRU|nr:bacteriophage tail fiber protein [Yersinia ruckeri]